MHVFLADGVSPQRCWWGAQKRVRANVRSVETALWGLSEMDVNLAPQMREYFSACAFVCLCGLSDYNVWVLGCVYGLHPFCVRARPFAQTDQTPHLGTCIWLALPLCEFAFLVSLYLTAKEVCSVCFDLDIFLAARMRKHS